MTDYAIAVAVSPAPTDYDLGVSKFFGAPTIPQEWLSTFDGDEIFFCQVRLAELAPFDPANRLPHTGYLYVFLHTGDGPYALRADVRYLPDEPDTVIEDFNAAVPEYERFTQAWRMEFSAADAEADGIKLFGTPSDWNYGDDAPPLLMQYDPLDSDMGFLDFLDGYLYLFFGADRRDLGAVTLHEEYS